MFDLNELNIFSRAVATNKYPWTNTLTKSYSDINFLAKLN